MTQDDIRANFLAALDRAELDVTDFEASFIESNMDRFNFSPRQRIAIDKMMAKYEDKIKFNASKGPSLAARAAAEEEKMAAELRKNQRVVIGGQVRIRPAKATPVRPNVTPKSQSGTNETGSAQPAE